MSMSQIADMFLETIRGDPNRWVLAEWQRALAANAIEAEEARVVEESEGERRSLNVPPASASRDVWLNGDCIGTVTVTIEEPHYRYTFDAFDPAVSYEGERIPAGCIADVWDGEKYSPCGRSMSGDSGFCPDHLAALRGT